jgi:zinc transporter ZupT|tara:strand:+ start:2216 stop:2398 length:183 start_codon:yes stop_codon:yes gene_type:complete
MEKKNLKIVGLVGAFSSLVGWLVGIFTQPFGSPLPIMHVIYGVLVGGFVGLYIKGSKEED